MKLAPVNATMSASVPSYSFPGAFKSIGTRSAFVETHFGTVNGSEYSIKFSRGQAETASVDVVKFCEDL